MIRRLRRATRHRRAGDPAPPYEEHADVSTKLEWTELDRKAVDTVRVLAMDAVQKVGNGHPGTAMSLAPAAYLLYNKLMTHDPSDPTWLGRDRFVLSCGHSSLTQYIQLYLTGFGLELADLEALRTWGSRTPGHPEFRHTPGVEVTTGPLGQGVGNAVGMAMAARRRHGLLEPDAPLGEGVFDHHVYAIASDGDMQEGVASEASSIAGTQQLGNLTLIWDDNRISIEDDTAVAFNEDVLKRYEAYGWHVQMVDWTHDGTGYTEDVDALWEATAGYYLSELLEPFEHGRSIIRGDVDEETRAQLLELREQRPKPLRDDKAIASWNGLALAAALLSRARTRRYRLNCPRRHTQLAKISRGDFLKRCQKVRRCESMRMRSMRR